MLLRVCCLALVVVAVVACKDDAQPFVFQAVIVDAEGGNPASGTDASVLEVAIREGDLPAQEFDFDIVDEQFDALLSFESFQRLTRLRISLDGDTTRLVTAPPAFVPSLTSGFMRVVTAPPDSCVRVGFNSMEAPRESFGMVQSGTFALLVGGTEATEEQVEFLDVLEWQSRLFEEDPSLSNLGPTRAASIDATRILVLPTDATSFIFDMGDPTDRVSSVVLHAGAGPRSGLVSVPGLGAMVIGGELGSEAQAAVSLVEPDGAVSSLTLDTPRAGATATALGSDVLVVGGDSEGTAELLLEGRSSGVPVASFADGVRDEGILVGDGQSRALLMGGLDEEGELRTDTVRFDECPEPCSFEGGPPWDDARLGVLQPARSALLIGGTNSRTIEEVRWSGADVIIEPAFDLVVPRASAGGIVLESGAFIVAGGNDGVSSRDDFEFCAVDPLNPL